MKTLIVPLAIALVTVGAAQPADHSDIVTVPTFGQVTVFVPSQSPDQIVLFVSGDGREEMAILAAGDGGWAELDKAVASGLAAAGVPTVGWSSLRY